MKSQQVSVGGLVLNKEGKILIVQRAPQEKFLPNLWEIPGGGSEYGETPQEALRREMKEECGIDVAVHAPLSTGSYFMEELQRVEIVFLCTLADAEQDIRLSEEHSNFTWVSLEELSKYSFDPYMEKLLKGATENLDYWRKHI